MAATIPGSLAPEVLEREDIRRALAEHDFAAVFALVKKYGGLSQNRIAVACQLTPGKVSKIISGSQRVTSFEVMCRISDGCGFPGYCSVWPRAHGSSGRNKRPRRKRRRPENGRQWKRPLGVQAPRWTWPHT